MAACSFGCESLEIVEFYLVNNEFEFDSAVLKPELKIALDRFLTDFALLDSDVILHIVGHTDYVGTHAYITRVYRSGEPDPHG